MNPFSDSALPNQFLIANVFCLFIVYVGAPPGYLFLCLYRSCSVEAPASTPPPPYL